MAVELLLLSTSRMPGGGYLEYARDTMVDFLGDARAVLFVPFARADQAAYTAQVAAELAGFGVAVSGLEGRDEVAAGQAIAAAEVLFVGGGNTFRLLRWLHTLGLMNTIRRRVLAGQMRYVGSSAGTNMACPTLRTTNDMPIVEPQTFEALGLVPFQINPHYLDADPESTHMGETREQRIVEFLEENDVAVVGLREGAWLRRADVRLASGGVTSARLFRRGLPAQEVAPGADLSWLLQRTPQFDVPQA